MEIINNEYIKVEKIDIMEQLVKAQDDEDINSFGFFKNLLDTILNYENANGFLREVYCHKSEFPKNLIETLPIKRQTMINAYLYASWVDFALKDELVYLLLENQITYNQLKAIKGEDFTDFVLEHSMDMNEFFDGEKPRTIYIAEEKDLEKAYIYGENNQKTKRLGW